VVLCCSSKRNTVGSKRIKWLLDRIAEVTFCLNDFTRLTARHKEDRVPQALGQRQQSRLAAFSSSEDARPGAARLQIGPLLPRLAFSSTSSGASRSRLGLHHPWSPCGNDVAKLRLRKSQTAPRALSSFSSTLSRPTLLSYPASLWFRHLWSPYLHRKCG
jgi:hypothetical protein